MKMHRNRRWLALLLSMLMVFTMMPSVAFANEQAEVLPEPDSGITSEQSVSDLDAPTQTDEAFDDTLQEGTEQTKPEADSQPNLAQEGVNGQSDTDAQQETTGYLTGLEFAMDKNGQEPIPMTPAFDKDIKEYTIEVGDYQGTSRLYQKYTLEDASVKVEIRYRRNGRDSSATPAAGKFIRSLYLDVDPRVYTYELSKNNSVIAKYTVNLKIKATLKDLNAGETMSPSVFDPDVKAYTAAVDAQDTTFTFTPTAYKDSYTITAAGVTGQSGQPMTIPLTWDADGQMQVPILVSGEGVDESEYVLNLKRAEIGNVPFIMANPYGGQKYWDTVKKEDITPLKVLARANGTLTYQWYENETDSSEGGNKVEGATEAVYYPQFELHDSTKDHYFYCEVTNTNGSGTYTAKTEAARVTVIPDPTPYDIQIVYEDGREISEEGIRITQEEETAPVFKTLFKTRTDGSIGQVNYTYYLEAKDGSGNINTGYNETYSIGNHNVQGYLYCKVNVYIDGVRYTASSRTGDSQGIPCTIYGTEAAQPGIILKTPAEQQYLVGTEKLDGFLLDATKKDISSDVVTSWQWMVSTDEGKTFEPIESEEASGVSKEEKPYKEFPIQYTPEGSDKVLKRYYKCRVTNTLKSYNGRTYTSYTDSPVITVSLQTVDSILDEGQSAWKGSGTAADPYQIVSANDLELLRQVVNEKGYPMKGVVFSMTQDITLPEGWTPIGGLKPGAVGAAGKDVNPFSGIFDGGGHTLTVPENGLPLLGYVRQATVRNMNLYGPKIPSSGLVHNSFIDYGPTGNYNEYTANGQPLTIEIDNVTIKSGTQTLSAGFTNYGGSAANIVNIRNCMAEPGVIIGYNKDQNWIGTFSRSLAGTIQNCSSAATVYGVHAVGGLAGMKQEAMGPCRVINCSFTGTIEATGSEVGGIIASGYGSESAPNTPCVTVKNCYVKANITGTTNVGGIFGTEPDCRQCWANGAGYIQNNYFYGKLTATAENGRVGGIVAYMRSLDRYNVVSNNYFVDTCGSSKAIGKVDLIDTTVPIERDDAAYVTTEKYARSDDPLGADADLLGKAQPAASFQDGTVAAALNAGAGSLGNWKQGTDYPVLSEGAVWADTLELSGYKTNYTTLDEFTSEGIQATVTMSDGSRKEVPVEEISFSGYV